MSETFISSLSLTNKHTHTCTHTHACAHTYTHTHTHTRSQCQGMEATLPSLRERPELTLSSLRSETHHPSRSHGWHRGSLNNVSAQCVMSCLDLQYVGAATKVTHDLLGSASSPRPSHSPFFQNAKMEGRPGTETEGY